MAAEASSPPGTAPGRSWTAVRQRLPRQGIRRLGWGIADQAISSITNFAIILYVARVLGATQLGAFSLAYVTYSFVLTASRGLSTDPLMVRFSGTDLPAWRRAVASCTGTATVVGLICGAVVLGVAAALGGTAREGFLALGLTLPGLMLQDSWRYSFFALGRGRLAFLNDLVWALAMVPGLLVLRAGGHENVFWFVLVWGAAACVAAAVGPLQAGVIPRPRQARAWVADHRDLGLRYLAENASNSGAGQLRLYGIGLIAGLAAVGYVQAATTLMGPFLVIYMGLSLVTVPEAARALSRSGRHLWLFCLLVSAVLTIMGLAWGAVLLVALPRGLGDLLLGQIWRPAYPLALPLTISVGGACVSAGASAGLHALGAARRSLRAMLVASAAYLGCALLGAYLGGALGSVRGIAVATWIGAAAWWWQLHAGIKQHAQAPAALDRPGPVLARPGPGQDARPPSRMPSLDDTQPLAPVPWPGAAGTRRASRPAPRARMPVRTRALLAAGGVVVLTAVGTTGWMLSHGSASLHEAVSTPARAHPRPPAASPVTGAPTPAVAPAAHRLAPVSATSFDPYGTGQGENGSLAPLAIDASPATAWHTEWYASPRMGNLKPGTGLLLDLGQRATIARVRILLGPARGATFQVRVGDEAAALGDFRVAAGATDVGGRVDLRLARPARGRYILIWFTVLPPDSSGTFQASVFNVRLRGWT
jgi:O-antigen/teichoic acid export membrane protein